MYAIAVPFEVVEVGGREGRRFCVREPTRCRRIYYFILFFSPSYVNE